LPDDPAAKAVTVNTDPAQEQEWLRQNNLIYGGLILIGVYMVQPFLTAASLDLSATICVVAFSMAIPLLAALVLVNRQEVFRRRVTRSVTVEIARVVAQLCAASGVVAGFWHISRIAGMAVLASGLVAIGVHSAGYVRLELKGPGDPEPGAPG
jgi:ABC-type amino acid transport system permease subunit